MNGIKIRLRILRALTGVAILVAFAAGVAHFASWPTVRAAEKEDTVVVNIDNFAFSPSTLTVAKGTKVTWVNRDDVPHNVVSTDKKFKSEVLDTDQQFSFTFADAGTYDYYCSLHPKMTGKVVVQ